jgi:Ca2+-binding RTX toxin-like protein
MKDHPNGRRRPWRLAILAAVLGGLVASSALAATIVGTPGNDVLRGTANADRLLGKGGNDRLFGMAGDDYLQGGAGVDRYVCGAGRDTVVAAPGEYVAKDCEVVRRVGAAPPDTTAPPPTDTTPAPSPPPPPAAPTPLAKPGFFGGFMNTGGSIHFVVAPDGLSFSQFEFSYEAPCQPGGRLTGAGVVYSGTIGIAPDRRFTADGQTEGLSVKLSGSFDASGTSVSGRFQVHESLDQDGVHYECDSGGSDWSAKWQG